MIFKQYNNGSCDIIFLDEEVKIIKEKQILHLSDEALRHFGNHLVKIVAEWQLNFNESIYKLNTKEDTEVKPDI
jgi:hypothetical protein